MLSHVWVGVGGGISVSSGQTALAGCQVHAVTDNWLIYTLVCPTIAAAAVWRAERSLALGWWAGEGRYLKASKQGMFKIVPDGTEMSFMSASVESVMPKKLLPTSNPSVAFSLKNVRAPPAIPRSNSARNSAPLLNSLLPECLGKIQNNSTSNSYEEFRPLFLPPVWLRKRYCISGQRGDGRRRGG